MIEIRSEKLQEIAGVQELNLLAFENGPEADQVDLLHGGQPGQATSGNMIFQRRSLH